MIDLDSHGKRFIASSGGKGGIGNVERRNLPRNKVNSTELRKGTKGGEREFEFELKCPAEVALVGFPNAGKSTLLAAVMPLI